MIAREDVERLFLVEHLPLETLLIYDSDMGRQQVPLIKLEEPWDSPPFLIEKLRSDVVRSILEARRKENRIRPFTLVNAHEAMANRDVRLDALLVHTDFVPLCENMTKMFFGIVAKLFAHHEVPVAEVYGLCQPEYLGRVPVKKGRPGAFRFSTNVVWGTFDARRGV